MTDWIQKAAEDVAIELDRYSEWRRIAAIIQRHVPAPAEEPVKACPVVCVVLPDGHDVPHYWVDPTRPIPPAPSNEPPEES
jgi:hypothetical protein